MDDLSKAFYEYNFKDIIRERTDTQCGKRGR